RALADQGHRVVFFEKDEPYYESHRDLFELCGGSLHFYDSWAEVAPAARRELADADAGFVTSYCPDATRASELVLDSPAISVFYDLDTPVTLSQLAAGRRVPYLLERGLSDFDLVLSFTGGRALTELRQRLGARRVAPLYGHVDPDVHRPGAPAPGPRAALSYLGTYAEDRQAALEALFVEPARRRPGQRFVLAGAQYPQTFPWTENIWFARHVSPDGHASFLSSSRLTLNVTRRAMAEMGHCPSGRLFEAAACGVPVVSDVWPGLSEFFEPDDELLCANTTEDVLRALDRSDKELARVAEAARQRVLDQHTSRHRAHALVEHVHRTATDR